LPSKIDAAPPLVLRDAPSGRSSGRGRRTDPRPEEPSEGGHLEGRVGGRYPKATIAPSTFRRRRRYGGAMMREKPVVGSKPCAAAAALSRPPEISAEEWRARVELAACYRIFAHLGWTELIYNHITLRLPGPETHFLINPFGLLYSEVRASNLVKID